MKHLAILLALVCSALGADQKMDKATLIERTKQFTTSNPNAVIELEGEIKLHNASGTLEGKYHYFQNGDQWRADARFAPYAETWVSTNGKVYVASTDAERGAAALSHLMSLFPLKLKHDTLMNPSATFEPAKVRDVAVVYCAEVERARLRACYLEDGSLITAENASRSIQFGSYAEVAKMHFPQYVKVSSHGHTAAELTITSMAERAKLPPETFAPFDAAYKTAFEHCTDQVKPAKPVFNPMPNYPHEARPSRKQGESVVQFVISEAGDPVGARTIEGSYPEFDRTALQAVKQWKYQPATCNGRPIASQTQVSFKFKL